MSVNGINKENINVLIIDDEPDIRDIFQEVLQRSGFANTLVASTGNEALKIMKKKFHNIALVDLNLPDINGMDLISKLKVISPDTELIIITGYGSMDTAIQALQFDVGDYLEKPISTKRLLRTLDGVIIKHNLKMENKQFLKDIEKANKEIQFLNDLLVNNVDDLNQSLLLTMVQIERLNPSSEQMKVLELFRKAIRKNARLTRNIKKIQLLQQKSRDSLTKIDLGNSISTAINRLKEDYSDLGFEINYDFDKTYHINADRDLNYLFNELFLNSILQDPSPKIKVNLSLEEVSEKKKEYIKLIVNAFKVKQIFDQKDIHDPTDLIRLKGQNALHDLGPFVINSLIKFYNGFIELPNTKKKNQINIYLPKVKKK